MQDPNLPTRFIPDTEVQAALAVNPRQSKTTGSSTCGSHFTAAQTSGNKGPNLRITAMAATVCPHGQVGSLQRCTTAGEKWAYASLAFLRALREASTANVNVKALFYDIMCRFWGHFTDRYPEVLRKFPDLVGALGRVHVNMHGPACKRDYGGVHLAGMLYVVNPSEVLSFIKFRSYCVKIFPPLI